MASETYLSVVLAQRPKDQIVVGETFSLLSKPRPTVADLQDGQILIEAQYLSLDPAMRGWLNGSSPIRCFPLISSYSASAMVWIGSISGAIRREEVDLTA